MCLLIFLRKELSFRSMRESIKVLVDAFLEERGLIKKVKGYYPFIKWKEIVGEGLSMYTTPLKYEDGTLFIGVSSYLFKRELEYMKGDILKAINEKIGGDSPIVRLEFKIMPLKRNVREVHKEDEPDVRLDTTDIEWIEKLVMALEGDEGLRKAYRNVLIQFKLREKKMVALHYKRCEKCGALFKGSGKLCPVCEIEDRKRK